MGRSVRILNLEDDPNDAELNQIALESEGVACELARVETREAFLAALDNGTFDVVLADYSLPSFDGLEALNLVRERRPDVPFIFVSGALGEEVAIEALKHGATDYILKDRLSRLGPAVRREGDQARLRLVDVHRVVDVPTARSDVGSPQADLAELLLQAYVELVDLPLNRIHRIAVHIL